MSTSRSLLLDQSGTKTVEWGLMGGLVVGGYVLTIAAIGLWLVSRFERLQTDLAA